jgi:tetraacyldisaccharide 4'-kinase
MGHIADRFWYRIRPTHLILFPLSLLFGLMAGGRRALHALGWLKCERLPVPVIVVGNITVGGTGKTPLVVWLAHLLSDAGYHPGIITRGYGGSEEIQAVPPDADPARAGDEPVLLAQRSRCPVWAGRARVAAGTALLRHHPEVDVIISDDGLQHYRLARDLEIAVVDGARRFGNGMLLPAGPLREPTRRLQSVDAVVVNTGSTDGLPHAFGMRLTGELLVNLRDPARVRLPRELAGMSVHALAGIGNPQRFFGTLVDLGVQFAAHAFPDHYAYRPEDLEFPGADAVLMTEKDAVKCAAFARESFWFLPVEADVDPALGKLILDRLEARHGRQAA